MRSTDRIKAARSTFAMERLGPTDPSHLMPRRQLFLFLSSEHFLAIGVFGP